MLPVVLAGIIGATSSEDGRDVFVRLLSNSFAGGFDNRRLLEPIGNIPPAEAETNCYAAPETEAMAA